MTLNPDIKDFGHHSFVMWVEGLIERVEKADRKEDVIKKTSKYLAMKELQRQGLADYS